MLFLLLVYTKFPKPLVLKVWVLWDVTLCHWIRGSGPFTGSDCILVTGYNFMGDASSQPRKVELSVSTATCGPTTNMRPDQKVSGLNAFSYYPRSLHWVFSTCIRTFYMSSICEISVHPENFFIYLINKYISLSDICLTLHHWYK